MPDRFMHRVGWALVGGVLLGACVSTPDRGVPSHYANDTVSARCLRDPAYCATLAGREVASGTGATVDVTGIVVMGALKVLDDATRASIQQAMQECADMARSQVLFRHEGTFAGLVPKKDECNSWVVDASGRRVTWAMRLGLEMHEVALNCAETKLRSMRPGGFSLKPRYRFNRETKEKSLISPEEKAALLKKGGEELKGTLEPDVVIHMGDPLQVEAVYDFKFRCVDFDREPEWRPYPPGHRYAGKSQGDIYKEAFGTVVHLIGPRKGVFW
jgi:hypothetical protein